MVREILKLGIELVPKSAWNRSLHDRMKRSSWDSLRAGVLATQGNRCAVCRSESKLSCHEAWEYDDENKIQKLIGFKAVCTLCHHVTHFGKAKLLAAEGRIDLAAVVSHFMAVNGASRETFEAHRTTRSGFGASGHDMNGRRILVLGPVS